MNGYESIKDQVINIVSEIIERPIKDDDLDANLIKDWAIDSLMALEILAVMEKEFGIEIPEEELPNFETIRKIIDVAERKVNGND